MNTQENLKAEFEKAFKYHVNGNLDKAEKLYKNILKQAPSHFDTLRHLGISYQDRQMFEIAERYYLKAYKINPKHFSILNNLGFEVMENTLEYFFNETQARYIISTNPLKEKQLISLAKEKDISLTKLGTARGENLCFGSNILNLDHINNLYHSVISNMMDNREKVN